MFTNILTALYEPFGFSLLLSFLAMFFYLYAYEPTAAGRGWKNAIIIWYQKFKESVFFRKLFLLAFVTSMILFRTLLNRNLWMNPLSKVMGGWGIWEIVNGERQLTTECFENVIMMVPFTSMVMWTFQEKVGNVYKNILWQSGKIAFSFSLTIEMLQLLFRLGTFQLADIVYNTLGGVIGGLMYCAVMRARKTALKKVQKEVATVETKKAKADAKAAEEAKKAEAEAVLKKLLASGMSADEILEKLK